MKKTRVPLQLLVSKERPLLPSSDSGLIFHTQQRSLPASAQKAGISKATRELMIALESHSTFRSAMLGKERSRKGTSSPLSQNAYVFKALLFAHHSLTRGCSQPHGHKSLQVLPHRKMSIYHPVSNESIMGNLMQTLFLNKAFPKC